MLVQIVNKKYHVSDEKAAELLKMASEFVPMGIYAIQKKHVITLLNCKCQSKSILKAAKASYKRNGYKVYCNGA